MTYILWTIALVAAILAAGWVVRFIGQKINWPKSELNVYFRDVGLTEISGYVLGVLALVYTLILYFSEGATFFKWAVNGFIIFTIAAYIFWTIGKLVGTQGSRKLFRQMPLTAAFGILIISIYAILSIFAGSIAPYGQEEIFEKTYGKNVSSPEQQRRTLNREKRQILGQICSYISPSHETTPLLFVALRLGGQPAAGVLRYSQRPDEAKLRTALSMVEGQPVRVQSPARTRPGTGVSCGSLCCSEPGVTRKVASSIFTVMKRVISA